MLVAIANFPAQHLYLDRLQGLCGRKPNVINLRNLSGQTKVCTPELVGNLTLECKLQFAKMSLS
jgi:hypothetical protein